MFENLSDRLERAFKIIKGQGYITEINVAETMKEVRKALLDADVSYKIAKEFTDNVKKKALGMNVLKAVSPSQLMVKLTYDELIGLMGREAIDINLKANPAIILMSGLQGSGKTTHAAKLANLLKTKRAKNGVAHAKEYGYDVVLIDTAGRLAVDQEMMDEIGNIKDAVNPHEILFVVDAMTGQDAVNTAKAFNDKLNFDGVILTKMDGDTRGGAALTIKAVVDKPIKFIGTGEKMEALSVFHPDRMAERILGMGDIRSFVEKAQDQFDQEEAAKLQKKLAKNQFDFNDFMAQIQQIKKMGNVKDLMSMIPGMGKIVKDMDFDDNAFKSVEVIIQSMTPEERANPDIINGSRRRRIANGSGSNIQDVNRLLKQFEDTRKIMRMENSGKAKRLMRAMNTPGRRPF